MRGEGTGQAGCWARFAGSGPSQRVAASFVKQGDGCGQREAQASGRLVLCSCRSEAGRWHGEGLGEEGQRGQGSVDSHARCCCLMQPSARR